MDPLRKDVVIVGGGAAGMAAAWQLRDTDLLLLEEQPALGGRLKSQARGGYWLNLGGHMFPAEGSHVRRLIDDLGLKTLPIPGSKTALSFQGKVYDSRRIESYPFTLPLSVRDRVQLARTGLRLRSRVKAYLSESRIRRGESEGERRARVGRFENDRTFRELLGPLPSPIDSIFTTAIRRAPAEMDELSAAAGLQLFSANWAGKLSGSPVNLAGGSGRLGEAVLQRLGDRVRLGTRVTSIEVEGGEGVVRYETAEGPTSVTARRVIVATPAPVARQLVRDLPDDVDEALGAVIYGAFVVMAALTREAGPMPWDDKYALLTPGMSFNMMFNHANPLRTSHVRQGGGSLMCYAGGKPGRDMLDMPDAEIAQRFTDDLYTVYPELRGQITETLVQKWPHGNCFRRPGSTFDAMRSYSDDPANIIQFCGDYFADVSGMIEEATRSGIETARVVASALALGPVGR